MMEVVVDNWTIRRAKLQSNCHHQQTNTQFILQAECPSCCPTNSVKALKGKSGLLKYFLPAVVEDSSLEDMQDLACPGVISGKIGRLNKIRKSHCRLDARTGVQPVECTIILLQCVKILRRRVLKLKQESETCPDPNDFRKVHLSLF